MAAPPAEMDLAQPAEEGVRLYCTLCRAKFSDLAHFVTHLGSKAHQSVDHEIKVAAKQGDQEKKDLYDTHEAFMDRHGLWALIDERKKTKEERKALGPNAPRKRAPPKNPRTPRRSRVKKAASPDDIGIKPEPEGPPEPFHPTAYPHQAATSAAPQPQPTVPEGELDTSRLKGYQVEGMGTFDAATPAQKRTRNQTKDESVSAGMQQDSLQITPVEWVMDLNLNFTRQRDIYAEPSIDGDSDVGGGRRRRKYNKSLRTENSPPETVQPRQRKTRAKGRRVPTEDESTMVQDVQAQRAPAPTDEDDHELGRLLLNASRDEMPPRWPSPEPARRMPSPATRQRELEARDVYREAVLRERRAALTDQAVNPGRLTMPQLRPGPVPQVQPMSAVCFPQNNRAATPYTAFGAPNPFFRPQGVMGQPLQHQSHAPTRANYLDNYGNGYSSFVAPRLPAGPPIPGYPDGPWTPFQVVQAHPEYPQPHPAMGGSFRAPAQQHHFGVFQPNQPGADQNHQGQHAQGQHQHHPGQFGNRPMPGPNDFRNNGFNH